MIEPKTIILCADDFGLNSGVSKGILKLASSQRLSAVGCMVNMPDFALNAPDLLALKHSIQIGLHFNITEGEFLSIPGKKCFNLHHLLIKAHLKLISPSFVAKEFNAQLDRFIQLMGFLPDFIDGHQHVHQLPQVRQVIFKIYHQRLKGAYMRSTYPTLGLQQHQIKEKIIALSSGKQLHVQLKNQGIPCNDFFSGIYDFNSKTNYRSLFRQWLAQAVPNTLIMCHPGEPCSSVDPIGLSRINELQYFLSDEFQSDCQEYSIGLTAGPVSR